MINRRKKRVIFFIVFIYLLTNGEVSFAFNAYVCSGCNQEKKILINKEPETNDKENKGKTTTINLFCNDTKLRE